MKKCNIIIATVLFLGICIGINSTDVAAGKVSFGKSSVTITKGSTKKIKLKNVKKKVKWKIKNSKIIKVKSKTGKYKNTVSLYGKKTGKTTIIAIVGKKNYKLTVKVVPIKKVAPKESPSKVKEETTTKVKSDEEITKSPVEEKTTVAEEETAQPQIEEETTTVVEEETTTSPVEEETTIPAQEEVELDCTLEYENGILKVKLTNNSNKSVNTKRTDFEILMNENGQWVNAIPQDTEINLSNDICTIGAGQQLNFEINLQKVKKIGNFNVVDYILKAGKYKYIHYYTVVNQTQCLEKEFSFK